VTTISLALDERTVAEIARKVAVELGTPTEPWLTVEQAAAYLACPTSRIYALVSTRRLEHAKDGRRVLFRREWLDAVVASRRKDSRP
jgi:excisionase family DNA binding protein